MSKEIVLNLFDLLKTKGSDLQYGNENVTQLEHALQCAELAEKSNHSKEIITAALLHDIGHLLYDGNDPILKGIDGKHENLGADYLSRYFDHKITLTSTTNSGERGEKTSDDLYHENTGDFWTYRPSEATLALDLSAILYLDDTACLRENQTLSHFRIDLISVNAPKGVVYELELVILF